MRVGDRTALGYVLEETSAKKQALRGNMRARADRIEFSSRVAWCVGNSRFELTLAGAPKTHKLNHFINDSNPAGRGRQFVES